ncbi:hypothetical protein QN388_25190, partial [Pseudomonas sp. 5B4]|nr:hypothetical protein [Pseudomonas sp. 5B4]
PPPPPPPPRLFSTAQPSNLMCIRDRFLDARTLRWLPWVVAIAFFMQSLDGTILNTALPASPPRERES